MTIEEIRDLFMGEVDCSSVVAGAFADEIGISESTLRKVAGCFGGGMMLGDTCGTVTAAYMLIGLKYGIDKPGEHDQKMEMIAKYNEFNTRFREKYPSLMCRDLLGYDVSKPGQFEEALFSGRMMSFCPVLASDVIDILKEIL